MQKHYCLYVFVVNIVVSISKRILLLNSHTLADIFWQIARSPTAYIYNYHMNTLHQLNPTAAAYIRNIPSQFCVAEFIPRRRYGQDTSNIVERINFDFKALRELPIVELLQTLWHKVMTTISAISTSNYS